MEGGVTEAKKKKEMQQVVKRNYFNYIEIADFVEPTKQQISNQQFPRKYRQNCMMFK